MRSNTTYYLFACVGLVTLFSGCGNRYAPWLQESFYQVGLMPEDALCRARSYLRTIYAYDQFSTAIRCDILWLNNAVRTAHTDLFFEKRGLSLENNVDLYQEMHNKNKRDTASRVVMYVMIAPQHDLYPVLSLSNLDALWNMSLQTDCDMFRPIAIELLEPDSEYRCILGDAYNRYRSSYRVVFDTTLDDDACISVVLRSCKHEVVLTWN